MKAIKRRISILLAVLMVFTVINPYAVSVKAQETASVEILSEEASEAKTPDKEESLPESSQEEKQEAVEETAKEAEIKEENKEEAKEEIQEEIQEEVKEEAKEAELAVREKTEEYVAADFDYDIIEDTVAIKGLSDAGKVKRAKNHNLVIPDTIEDKNVTVIKQLGFINQASGVAAEELKFVSVTLPKYLEEIGNGAFTNNSITEIKFPTSLKKIGSSAFSKNKLTSVFIPNSVIEIGSSAFVKNRITKAEIDNNADGISVNDTAFYYNGVNGKETIPPEYLRENPEWVKDDFQYERNGSDTIKIVALSGDGETKRKTDHNLVIPDTIDGMNVTEIVAKAFLGKDVPEEEKFVSVELPKHLVTIGEAAFSENKLSSVTFPKSLQTIGNAAFSKNEIKEVFIPESVTKIDIKAFAANNLTQGSVKIDNKKENVNIGESAFGLQGKDENITVKPIYLKDLESSQWEVDDFEYDKMIVTEILDNGSEQEVELEAVTGFSAKGLEKVKTVKDLVLPIQNDKGKPVVAVGNGAFRGEYGKKRLNSLTIPDGYKMIGVTAFAFNGCGGALTLPESIETVDFAAFFRNEFTSLTTGTKLTIIPTSMMRGNRLKTVTFKGEIETIGDFAFAENDLQEVEIPKSLKKIANAVLKDAFMVNPGHMKYDDKVVLWTPDKDNPNQLKDTKYYVVDPKKPTSKEIDYSTWTKDDFKYAGQTIKGFSETGLRKIKRNKNLEIPATTPDDKPVTKLGLHAFRNLQTGYNIETVSIPDKVEEIGNYALQFNNLTEVKLPSSLKKLKWGVFMNNKLTKVEFNDKLEYIDIMCFANNELGTLVLPRTVKTVMNAAFRKCDLTSVKFGEGSELKVIEANAFSDNKLTSIDLPDGIETIGRQAFANQKAGIGNQFTELNVPASLKKIGFQAFANNPGVSRYKAVVIHTPKEQNPAGLVDDLGKTFVVDPLVKATDEDKGKLKDEIAKAKAVNVEKLTKGKKPNKGFREFFEEVLNDSEKAYSDTRASKAKVLGLVIDLSWAVERAELNKLMFDKESLDPKSKTFDKEKWAYVEEAYKAAKKYLMIINITDGKLRKLIKDLDIVLQNLGEQGPLTGTLIYEGEASVPKTVYVKPYDVKVRVWVKDGQIVFVKDNKTECDAPGDEEEPNRGYFEQAIEILYKYIGKDVDIVKNNRLGDTLNIHAISTATMSSKALHAAIQNALGKDPINPNTPAPNPPVNPDPQTPDPAPPTVDPIPDNGGFIPPLDSGSSSGSSSSGSSIDSTARTENTIKDDETPLANVPNEAQALILKSKKNTVKLTDKQLSDLITGKSTHIEITVGAVTVKLMPQDVKPFFKKGNGKNYLKISKLSKAEIKKLKLDKKTSEKDAYKLELMISGKKVMNLKKKATVQMLYTGEIKKDTVTVLLAEAKKTIKAKYNKKTKMIEFKTNKIGTFLVLK